MKAKTKKLISLGVSSSVVTNFAVAPSAWVCAGENDKCEVGKEKWKDISIDCVKSWEKDDFIKYAKNLGNDPKKVKGFRSFSNTVFGTDVYENKIDPSLLYCIDMNGDLDKNGEPLQFKWYKSMIGHAYPGEVGRDQVQHELNRANSYARSMLSDNRGVAGIANKFVDILSKTADNYKTVGWIAMLGLTVVSLTAGIKDLQVNFHGVKSILKPLLFYLGYKKLDAKKSNEIISRIKERFDNEVIGQEEQKTKILDYLQGYLKYLVICNELGIEPKKGAILTLAGEPGTGKTLCVNIITEELGSAYCSLGLSDISEDKGNNAQNVVAKLLKPYLEKNVWGVESPTKTKLTQFIENGEAVTLVIDEFEKLENVDYNMRNIDPTKTKIRPRSTLADSLQNYTDNSILFNKYMPGSLVILTTNHTKKDLENYDPSWRDRIKDGFVEFGKFSDDDFYDLFVLKSRKIRDYYEKKNLKCVLDEPTFRLKSKMLRQNNESGRAVVSEMIKIATALENFSKKEPEAKNAKIMYSEDGNVVNVTAS